MTEKKEPLKKSVVSEDGTRYIKRTPNANFGSIGRSSAMFTKSCIKCGKHKAVNQLESTKLAGRNYLKCIGGCEK